MVYSPGHFERVTKLSAPSNRRKRRNLTIAFCGLLAACLLGFSALSLTNSAPRTGGGCIAFGFMTVVGGSSDHACGATARNLCLAPVPTVFKDSDYYAEMHQACRRAGLKTSSDKSLFSS
jgi:hypothetical protein